LFNFDGSLIVSDRLIGSTFYNWRRQFNKSENDFKVREAIQCGRSRFHFSESDSKIGGGDYKIWNPISKFGHRFYKSEIVRAEQIG